MSKKSRMQNTIINTISGIMTRMANMLARFMLQTVLIYVLGIQYTGISGLFTSVLTILSLAELGIGNAITFELYRPLEEKNEKRIALLMKFYRSAYLFVALIILTVGLVLIPFLPLFVRDIPDIKESIVLIYIMYLLKTVSSYLLIYKSTILVANQQNYIVSRIQAVVTLVRTTIECVVLLVTQQYITYLVLEIVGNVAQNIWISYLADNQYPVIKEYCSESLEKKEKRALLSDIKGMAMYKTSFALGNGVDNIIISACVNTQAVGLVSNYTLIRKELEQIIKQFYNAVVPSVGNLAVTATEDKQHEVFLNLLFLNFLISNFCSVSYFVIIQPFIVFWIGKKYLLSIAVAAVLAWDFYLSCMMNSISSFRTANGIFIKGQYRPLIMVIVNVFLSVLLGIHWEIVGVFAATIIARLTTQWYDPLLLYRMVFRRSPKKFYYRYYSYMVVTILCAILTYSIARVVSIQNIFLDLLFRFSICLFIPNGMVIALYHKSVEFRYCVSQVRNLMNRLRKRGKKVET